jgi:hypothetical protein
VEKEAFHLMTYRKQKARKVLGTSVTFKVIPLVTSFLQLGY